MNSLNFNSVETLSGYKARAAFQVNSASVFREDVDISFEPAVILRMLEYKNSALLCSTLFLRSERDSNSRYAFGVYTLSRRASSATRASLLVFAFAKIVQIERRKKSLLVFSSEKTAILVNAKIEGSAVAAGSHRVEDYAIFSRFSGDFHYINALFKFFGCRFDSVRLFYAC